jgi:acetyltransferase-like isoleucine patch superfamily enzyme
MPNTTPPAPRIKHFSETGEGNAFAISPDAHLDRLVVMGSDNDITIGGGCILRGQIVIKCNGAKVWIGEKTTAQGVRIHLHEPSQIYVGEDCMFSGGVSMDVSDNHSIIDLVSGDRINPPAPIEIGHHVWVGQNCTILKGSTIGRDSVIGAGSMVKGIIPPNSVAAGIPVKIVRQGVTWDRRRL